MTPADKRAKAAEDDDEDKDSTYENEASWPLLLSAAG